MPGPHQRLGTSDRHRSEQVCGDCIDWASPDDGTTVFSDSRKDLLEAAGVVRGKPFWVGHVVANHHVDRHDSGLDRMDR